MSPDGPRDRIRLANLLADAGYWAGGTPRPTDSATCLRRRERKSQRYPAWRLLVSDDRFSRRLGFPRLASPVSTYEVETSHPLVSRTRGHGPPSLTPPGAGFIPVSLFAGVALTQSMPLPRRPIARVISR